MKKVLCSKNIEVGYIYFYVHFVTEVLCFYVLTKQIGNSSFLWAFPLIYDAVAFVPQSIIGYVSDYFPKINMGIIGTILLVLGIIFFRINIPKFISLIVLCFGNAFLHVDGAEVTLRSSKGKLSHSAIFVAGGSFGVIAGKLLASTNINYPIVALFGLTMIPFVLLGNCYRNEKSTCKEFNYNSLKVPGGLVVILSVLIVIVRGYMGYGIPTSWNKTIFQTIMLYVSMGVGKALGGILADYFGVRKVALISSLLALPFLLFGDNVMMISLIGVLLFSMTMSITLALLVSVLKNTPGLAFGLTTIGLFLGTVPIFFFKFETVLANSVIIAILTILCFMIMSIIIRKDDIHG